MPDATSTTPATVSIDPRADALEPVATLPVVGTMGFLPDGNLCVLERRWDEGCVIAHEYAPGGATGWREVHAFVFKNIRSSPVGCAVSPDGATVAMGTKTARVYPRRGGKPIASAPAVRYQLDWSSLGFSPSGALLAVADGGYVSPRNRVVHVCDAATGEKRASIKTDEWDFAQAMMLDESTVVTLGLALDWEYGDDATSGQRVLGCYDVARAQARWRRVLRGGQLAALDRDARCVWVAGDEGPSAPRDLLALAADDGRVLRELRFADGWRPGAAAPVALGAGLVALHLGSPALRTGRYVVLDAERGAQRAVLALRGEMGRVELQPAAHAATRRVAAAAQDATLIWQLP